MSERGTGRFEIVMDRAQKRPESARPTEPEAPGWKPDEMMVWWWCIKDPAGEKLFVGWEIARDHAYIAARNKMREIRSQVMAES